MTGGAAAVADRSAVWRIVDGYPSYWALASAVELGVFDALAGGPADAATVAAVCGATDGRLDTLLDALAALGLLARDAGRYALTPVSEELLVRGSPGGMAELVLRAPGVHANWPALASVLRGGRPPAVVDEDAASFHRGLVRSTMPVQLEIARSALAALGDVGSGPVLVDVGAGAAPWTVALLEADTAATAIVNDLPGVLDVAREELGARGLAERVTLLPGDYFEVDLPEGTADLVVLGHVCRSEGPSRAPVLVERAARVLRPGGRLVVADYLVDEGDLAGSLHALALGLTMVANTRAGTTFTAGRCRDWLADAGLAEVTELAVTPPTSVLVATKPMSPDKEEDRP